LTFNTSKGSFSQGLSLLAFVIFYNSSTMFPCLLIEKCSLCCYWE